MPQPLRVELPHPPAAVRLVPGPSASAAGPAADPSASTGETRNQLMQTALDAERAELAQARRALEQAAARIGKLHEQVVADAEAHLPDLAIEIARNVLMQEIEAGRHDIEPIVRRALRSAPANREVVVRLHPEDLAQMEKAQAADSAAPAANVRLVADSGVGRAECVVETAEGTVEARIEDELEQVKQALKNPE